VALLNDALSEDTETVKLTLSAPTGGKLGTPITATVAILDDDDLPVVSIADASVLEPNGGAANLVFKLALSAPAGRAVSVGFHTSDMSALAGNDYTAKTGSVAFPAGTTAKTIAVPVRGDTADEDNEAFLVSLVNPVKLALGRSIAQGTILDNDGRPALCQPIARVPYTISTSGSYCLAGDLSFDAATGEAITVDADFVRLDLRGHRLAGAYGSDGPTRGVYSSGRTGLVVKNGRVHGFDTAILLEANYPYAESGLHLVEEIEAESSGASGIVVMGRHSTVLRSVVLATGGEGNEEGGLGSDAYGIVLFGPAARALENDVSGTEGTGSGVGRALVFDTAPGAIALGNRLTGTGSGTGLVVRDSLGVLAIRNRLLLLSEGLYFDESSTGSYRGNFTSGVSNPYQGGTDAGGNQ
jgi:hypothetical protein